MNLQVIRDNIALRSTAPANWLDELLEINSIQGNKYDRKVEVADQMGHILNVIVTHSPEILNFISFPTSRVACILGNYS